MARYAQGTLKATVAAIDVIEVAGAISASAAKATAFPFVVPFEANRVGIFAQNDSMTWSAVGLDTALATLQDEQAFTPVGRAYECTGNIADVVIGQLALADYATAGKSIVDAIIEEGTIGYVTLRDGLLAAQYGEAMTTSPDHSIGLSTSALTKGLIDQGIRLLLAQSPPDAERLALVIHTSKIEELFAIPGMNEKSIIGGRDGGIGGPSLSLGSKMIVSGYNGVLDIYHSPDIVSSTGYRNLMVTASSRPNSGCFANPWHPLETPNGKSGHIMVDVEWNSARRAIEVNMTTQEYLQGKYGSTTDNKYMVELKTA